MFDSTRALAFIVAFSSSFSQPTNHTRLAQIAAVLSIFFIVFSF